MDILQKAVRSVSFPVPVFSSLYPYNICSLLTLAEQNHKKALHQIEAYLDGDMEARIDCDYEGELYRLFHEINTMAAVLNAHALNGIRDKDF